MTPLEKFYTDDPRWHEKIGDIHALLERVKISEEQSGDVLHLRKLSRILSIHASTAIEGNRLTLGQVTDVINGKPVWGPPKDIKEVQNAWHAYNEMTRYDPWSVGDLLTGPRAPDRRAHRGVGPVPHGRRGRRARRRRGDAPRLPGGTGPRPGRAAPALGQDQRGAPAHQEFRRPLHAGTHPPLPRRQRQNRAAVADAGSFPMESAVRLDAGRNPGPPQPGAVLQGAAGFACRRGGLPPVHQLHARCHRQFAVQIHRRRDRNDGRRRCKCHCKCPCKCRCICDCQGGYWLCCGTIRERPQA